MVTLAPMSCLQPAQLSQHQWLLDKRRVDVWLFKKNLAGCVAEDYLHEKELRKAEGFYFQKHKLAYLNSHAWMKKILGLYLDTYDLKSLSFEDNEYGKPFLSSHPELQFNLSHAGEWVVLALGSQYSVGVDIEYCKQMEYFEIARLLYSEKEVWDFEKLPSYLKSYGFFQIWAQKEAFIKAIGMGLSYPTTAFSVKMFSKPHEPVLDVFSQSHWYLTRFYSVLGYASALCTHEAVDDIRLLKVG